MTSTPPRTDIPLHVRIAVQQETELAELCGLYGSTKAQIARRALAIGLRVLIDHPDAFRQDTDVLVTTSLKPLPSAPDGQQRVLLDGKAMLRDAQPRTDKES